MQILDEAIKNILEEKISLIEDYFKGVAIFFYGPLFDGYCKTFRDFIEKQKLDNKDTERLIIILNTPGGSAEAVEKYVEIIRFHFKEVYFVVPDYALSAGTIFCMSGDKIFMDYSSSLGPIDPQVHNGKDWVPALGYLDQVEKLLEKSKKNELTDAELLVLQNQDLAMLSRYEQAKNLTITLLKKWLVEYKFKNWISHRTDPAKRGMPVTEEEKIKRAGEVAEILGDNKTWHSHGRMIGVKTLRNVVKLEIDDYSDNSDLRNLIRGYNDIISDYINRQNMPIYLHSKSYF